MSAQNIDKVVKLACKPKNAPPKPKVSVFSNVIGGWLIKQYVDVLVAATYSDDGSLNTACAALAMRLREQNGVVSVQHSHTRARANQSGRVQGSLDPASDDPVRIDRSAA
jgi:hypothetical protein